MQERSTLGSCLLLIALLGFCGAAFPHPAPFSFLDLYLDESGIQGALVIHDFDAAHELGIEPPEALRDLQLVRQRETELKEIVASRLHLRSDGRPVTPEWKPIEVLIERQSLRLPFTLGAAAGRIEIDTVIFPYDPVHQTFVNIYEGGKLEHQAILDASRHTMSYYAGTAQGRWAVVSTFVRAGVHHIFIGPDHILFLFGLLLLGGSLWRLGAIVTAFTVGHSITLSLAALGIVEIPASVVEPAIALSIVVVGVDNLLVRREAARRAPSAPVRDLRPWLAAAFGLVHGFGFASVLLEFGLPREALGWSLAAFNIGVEIGQLAIVVVLGLMLGLARRCHRGLTERLVLFGSLSVIAAGVYWFVERIT
jgi:hydrogenase/urease accessory protein HupE